MAWHHKILTADALEKDFKRSNNQDQDHYTFFGGQIDRQRFLQPPSRHFVPLPPMEFSINFIVKTDLGQSIFPFISKDSQLPFKLTIN